MQQIQKVPAAPVLAMDNHTQVKWMTCLMFFVFAMTTDAVGVIIPKVVEQFQLSLTEAAAFHYVPMIFIGLSGLFLGRLADKVGRKKVILAGLALYTLACVAFAFGDNFMFYLLLLGVCGLSIGLFKTGALALLGDISSNADGHTKLMNRVEGFFGLGAIAGPALVGILIAANMAWTQLYLLAGLICAILLVLAWRMDYPAYQPQQQTSLFQSLVLVKDKYALGFSLAIACYVATEVAIFVWLPTLLQQYQGDFTTLAAHAITVFFILRTVGRFLAEWLLSRFNWTVLLAWFGSAIFICFALSMLGGVDWALWLMPLSGLFMSMMYPTLNSKGISCFERHQHGAVAGLILAFTALAAALGPLLMGLVGDVFGNVRYGFYLATGFALLMAIGLWWNHLVQPAAKRLAAVSH
ncbi:MFS transporter [Rheinheimera riviphila]|uniref:MFS transporter n=1 Tax=Rheinheimera riviphila TaxID=1834037 RepID=A0A437QGM0_9GAMM|nr:MFS transporter [Rheinheimera riviphila]RVU33554.1 MFS transporter [Rheinheimera riviphila]